MINFITQEQLGILSNAYLSIMLLIFISLSIRFVLILLGQSWIKTYAHTATLTLLPIITFVITKVISGNIALSLGMVGALSIVRFRNPVKSPFELSIYFGSITMGIAASVSMPWLIVYASAIFLTLFILFCLDIISSKIFGRPMFVTSFSEGNQLSTLEINSSIALDSYLNSHLLISHRKDDDQYLYILASDDKFALTEICSKLSKDSNIIRYNLNS